MTDRGTVVWAPDPFKADGGNPRPRLGVSCERMLYLDNESIAVAFMAQSHHAGSVAVPSEAWIRGEPGQRSFVLPWTVATLKRRHPRPRPAGFNHPRIHCECHGGQDHLAGRLGASSDRMIDDTTLGLESGKATRCRV